MIVKPKSVEHLPTEISVNICSLCYDGKYRKVKPTFGGSSKILVIYGTPSYSGDLDSYRVRRLCGEIENETNVDLMKYTWIPVVRCAFDVKVKISNVKNCLKHLEPYIKDRVILFGKEALSYIFYEGGKPPNMDFSHGKLILNKSILGKKVQVIPLIGTEIFDKYEDDPIMLEEKLRKYGETLKHSELAGWG